MRGLVRETRDGYDFTHEKLSQIAYQQLSRARRQWIHRRIADLLEADQQAANPAQIAQAISARNDDVLALTQADFAREEKQIIKDMSVEVLNMMNLSGLLIGLAVTALTLYTSTLRKRQEYGVLKAIGAKNRHLYAVVIAQTFFSMALGFAMAIGLVWGLGQVIPLVVPGVGLTLTQTAMTRVLAASLVIGIIAALIPAWQVARLDPAQVFRG